jgi:hypothetical protein
MTWEFSQVCEKTPDSGMAPGHEPEDARLNSAKMLKNGCPGIPIAVIDGMHAGVSWSSLTWLSALPADDPHRTSLATS